MAFTSEHKEWLEEHGLWKQCWRRKEELKDAGHKPAGAQRLALREFYRPNDMLAAALAQAGTDGAD